MFVLLQAMAAEIEEPEINEAFGFAVYKDLPYVPVVLDKQIQRDQTLDVYKPVDADSSPVVIYVHGGG